MYLPKLFANKQGAIQGEFLNRQEFRVFFTSAGCFIKIKESSLTYYLLIAGGGGISWIPIFPKSTTEMWNSNRSVVSNDYIHSTTSASLSLSPSLSLSLSLSVCVCACGKKSRVYISKVKLATVVESDLKAPFSIATTPMCRGGRYSFPWIAPLYPWYVPYIAEC